MKHLKFTLLVAMAVLCSCLFFINVYAADANSDAERSEAAPAEWEFVLELYGWIAEIEATTASGHDLEMDFDTIIDNLDFTIMAVLGVRKNKWSFMVDVINLQLENDPYLNLNPVLQLTSIEIDGWAVNPFVSYEIFGSKKGSFQVLAGARYLGIDVDLGFRTLPPLPEEFIPESGSTDIWDGIVGIRGFYYLTDRWFVPYRADIGTGDSDFTWSAFAGIGYKFDSFKLLAVYRYMEWEFEDDAVLEDQQISGPVIGAIFTF